AVMMMMMMMMMMTMTIVIVNPALGGTTIRQKRYWKN
ncbi:MAG: hypothetical protein JWO14_1086, partial [Solirubrobacterales bacterium]|nr:hypothetical protein [Solirubrobacterales bacterium]